MRYYRRRRNFFGTEGSYAANPSRGRRGHRRNPIDVMKVDTWFGARDGLAWQAAAVSVGVVMGEKLGEQIPLGTSAPGYTAPATGSDVVAAVVDGATRAGIGVVGGMLIEGAGQKQLGEAFLLGGVAAGVMKFAANLNILKGILTPGSIRIGGNPLPAPTVTPLPTPADVRGRTVISPVHEL